MTLPSEKRSKLMEWSNERKSSTIGKLAEAEVSDLSRCQIKKKLKKLWKQWKAKTSWDVQFVATKVKQENVANGNVLNKKGGYSLLFFCLPV